MISSKMENIPDIEGLGTIDFDVSTWQTYLNIFNFNRRNASGWNENDTSSRSWKTRRTYKSLKGMELRV